MGVNIKGNKEKEGYALAVSCNHVSWTCPCAHLRMACGQKMQEWAEVNFLHTNELFVLFFSRVQTWHVKVKHALGSNDPYGRAQELMQFWDVFQL